MPYLDYTGLSHFKEKITKNIEDVVLVQDTQPIENTNKIWIKETPQESIQIPTYAEYMLNTEAIENTVQSYIFNQQGDLQQVLHKRGNVAIRTDVFQFNTDNIVETRTLNSGESLTITTDLENMSTSIVYNEG